MTQLLRALEQLRCEPNLDAGDFRRAMRHLVGAVTLVTSTDGETPVGLTATAVSSFSAQPARILACVNLQGSSFRTIAQSRRMAINLLTVAQSDLARVFAGLCDKAGERFDPLDWETLVTGAPVLRGALAAFDCVVDEMMVAHSHAVVIGEIKAVRIDEPHGLPLLYAGGQFTTLQDSALAA